MGKLNSVVTFKGRTGNLVGAKGYKGSTVLRQYQPTVANPNTMKQRTQRTKFLAATTTANSIPDLALAGLRGYAKSVGCSARNAFSRLMLREPESAIGWHKTVNGNEIEMTFDKASLKFSKGTLQIPSANATSDDPMQVDFAINLPAGLVPANCRAIAVLLSSSYEGQVIAKEGAFSASSLNLSVQVPSIWSGTKAYCYVYIQDFGSAENLQAYYRAAIVAAVSDVYLAESQALTSPTVFAGEVTVS